MIDIWVIVALSAEDVLLYVIESVVLAARSVGLLQVEFLLGLCSESWEVGAYVGYLEVFDDFSLRSVWQFLEVLTKNLHFTVGVFHFAFFAFSFESLKWNRFSWSSDEQVVVGRLGPRLDGASLICTSLIHVFLYAVFSSSSVTSFSSFGGSRRCHHGCIN